MPSGQVFDFNDVFRAEIAVINARRECQQRAAIVLQQEVDASTGAPVVDASGAPVLGPNEDANLVGLALSGGGVRSAAFCLGALQGLNEAGVLERVDYLSTVSGGGYIACSLSAGLETTGGEFPFESRVLEDETPAVQHLRDHSNYLFPGGVIDLLRDASIYARGLIVNFILIMQIVLLGAAITIVAVRHPNMLGAHDSKSFASFFPLTMWLAVVLLIIVIGWGVWRSMGAAQKYSEVPSGSANFVGWAFLAVLLLAVCEAQIYFVEAMFLPEEQWGVLRTVLLEPSRSLSAVEWSSPVLAAIVSAVAFFERKLGEFVKSATQSSRMSAKMVGYATKAALCLAALIVPYILWIVYLQITYWGLCINSPLLPTCSSQEWLVDLAGRLPGTNPAAKFYLLIALLLFVLTLFLRPNANSLHPLYRDRLGKAFLFKPKSTMRRDEELVPLRMHLSQLSGKHGPYHLINTALNIQNSKSANKRGRNADFFLLSQQFIGSETTGYAGTKDIEKIAPGLDLASAMAISGAAASANMGSQSIGVLTPTLAILNVRLGYWLRNPKRVGQRELWKFRNIWANYYFLLEMLGLLNEHRKSVYLTDGGHIENLGIYELLKRRCRVIIVVDAEADPEMAFGSFNTLVRYARIDLGLEIDLPWQQIANVTKKTSHDIDTTGDCPKLKGPHCAVGEISYPCGRKGILVYIKSSLTGDENDYVFHYRKRYAQFPHETTVDQMFSEEQFEAYRALGYHAAYGLFDRRDDFAKLDNLEFQQALAHALLLDELFPRVTKGTPGPHQGFADWPPAPPAADPVKVA